MGNIVNNSGSVVYNQTMNNFYGNRPGQASFESLALDLAKLRAEIRAREKGSAEGDVALGALASAEIAAKKSDEKTMLQHLKVVGTFGLKIASEIGTSVAADAIKKALGM